MASADAGIPLDLVIKGIEILSFLGGIGATVWRFGQVTGRLEELMGAQADEISELKDETRKLGDVLTRLAVQAQQITDQNRQIAQIQTELFELRHGRGFVTGPFFADGAARAPK